jgi:hypothetical protein
VGYLDTDVKSTIEFHLSGLIGMASHPDAENPDMAFFFENRLHWQFEVRLLQYAPASTVS